LGDNGPLCPLDKGNEQAKTRSTASSIVTLSKDHTVLLKTSSTHFFRGKGGVVMCSTGTAYGADSKPDIVALGEVVLAAGLMGQGITLCYSEFPACALAELWMMHRLGLAPRQTVHVHTQADVRRYEKEPWGVRLLLVHNPRFHVITNWVVRLMEATEGVGKPAVLSRAVPADVEDDPGATLVVRASPTLTEDAVQWLQERDQQAPEVGVRVDDQDDVLDQVDQLLDRICGVEPARRQKSADRLRDRRVLRGLISGSHLLRQASEEDDRSDMTEDLLGDYERVRLLLRRVTATTPDDPLDGLAVDMVSRSNVYLGVRFGADQSDRNPFRPENLAFWLDRTDDRPPREPITRREIADLGNIGSGTVRRLVAYLQEAPDGYERFLDMGLARGRPDRDSWHRQPSGALAALLKGWSYKQVRTHFQRLQRAGMITAERRHENGPWCYQLPEELTVGRSRFDYLPPAATL
jgi:hypothetical protein